MRNLFLFLIVLAFVSCKHPQKQKSNIETLELKDFFYPYKELVVPKVYVYQNQYSQAKQYELVKAAISSGDTVLEITRFDSLLVKKFRSRYRIDDLYLTQTSGMLYIATGKGAFAEIPITYIDSAYTWARPLSKDSTYVIDGIANLGEIKIDIKEKGYFEKSNQAPGKFTYKPYDIIRNPATIISQTSTAIKGKKLIISSVITYYARGLGVLVYEEPKSDLNPANQKYNFVKAISVSEFEALSHTGS